MERCSRYQRAGAVAQGWPGTAVTPKTGSPTDRGSSRGWTPLRPAAASTNGQPRRPNHPSILDHRLGRDLRQASLLTIVQEPHIRLPIHAVGLPGEGKAIGRWGRQEGTRLSTFRSRPT